MRILHVVHTPRFSGAEILVADLTKAHAEMGHVSQVVSFNPPEDDFLSVINQQSSLGVSWISPKSRLTKLGRLFFIANTKKKFKPDVIFAHSVIPAVYARLVAPNSVVTVLHAENNYESRYFSTIERLLQWITVGVISVSETARQKYAEIFSHPMTKYIPNGIDVKKFEMNLTTRNNVRRGFGLMEDCFLILQVGRIDRVKQQHLSILTTVPLIKANPGIHLYFMGLVEDQEYLTEMQETIRTSDVEKNIHLLGARSDVADMLCAADLFLMPSAREAQGIALIEALASGVSIVASDIDNFQFAQSFDGVSLLSPRDIGGATTLIQSQIVHPARYKRDLSKMNIQATAIEYINFAEYCFSHSR